MTHPPQLFTSRYLLPIVVPPIECGAFLVSNRQIVSLGTLKELSSLHPWAPVIDFGDSLILPPMVNAHSHLELTCFADWQVDKQEDSQDVDFVDWILNLIKVRSKVSPCQMKDSLSSGLNESLMYGTGAIGDICTTLDHVAVYNQSPLYGKVFVEVLGHEVERVNPRLKAIEHILHHPPGKSLSWGVSPHSPYTLSRETLDKVFRFIHKKGLVAAMHLAESREEMDFFSHQSGAISEKLYPAASWNVQNSEHSELSPIEFFCQSQRLKKRDLIVHGVHVDNHDLDLIKKHQCAVVLCPRSNANLGVGKAPIDKYLKFNIPLAIGTDSLASGTSLSVWEEIAFAYQWFDGQVDAHTLLRMATLGGAKALGLDGKLGALSPGCYASFQVVTLPQKLPGNDLDEVLCTAGDSVEVTHLYLGGENVLP